MALTKISGNVVQQNNFSLSGVVTATSFTGDLTGNVTGNVTGTATTATNLADGANITTGTISNDRLPATITKNLTGDVTGNLTGNVSSSGANTLGSLTVTNDATVGGALTVTGDLTVNGTTTTIDTAVTAVDSLAIDGSVGIGTDNPGSYFSDANDIVIEKTDDCGITIASGTSQKGTIAFADGTTGDQAYRGYIQYNHSTDSLQVATTGTERLRVTSTGNIGIGTDNPVQLLDVTGSGDKKIRIASTSSGAGSNSAILLETATEGKFTIQTGNAVSGGLRIYDANAGSERLRIDSNGLIANNGRLPSSYGSPNLLISGTDSTLTLMGDGSTNSTSFTGIKFRVAGASTGDYTKAGIFSRREGGYNDLSIIFALDTVADSSSVSISDEKVRITSSGILSVNRSNTTGNNKLQVCGNGDDTAFVRLRRLTGAGDDSAYGGINVVDNNNVTIGTAEFRNQDSTTRSQFVLSTYDNNGSGLSEAIRVKGNGNVGIGTDIIEGKLTIFATAAEPPTSGTTANSAIQLYSSLSNQMNFGLNTVNGNYGAYIQVNDNNHAVNYPLNLQPNGGNIGIGTDAPSSQLQIYSAGPNLRLTATDNTNASVIQFGDINDLDIGYLRYEHNGDYLRIGANNNERLRIQDSAEAVKVIGETALTGTTGGAKGLTLQTSGGTSCPLYFGSETHSAQKSMYLNGYWIYLRGHQNEGIRFIFSQSSGNAPRSDQYEFKYNAAYRPTGNTTWDGFSDRRAKENIQDVTSALDTIGRLRPVTFDWTNDYADRMNMFNLDKTDPRSYMWTSVKENGYDETRKNNNVGFIAQEFEEVFPNDITETEMQLGDETISDFKTVNFDSLIPMLTKAVQELKAENDSLRARLDAAGL